MGFFRFLIKLWNKDKHSLEIVKNLRFNPSDKLCLEYSKLLYQEGDYHQAIAVLKAVTQKLNADWRAVYRSFALLSIIYRRLGMEEESQRYGKLCLTCNPNYPLDSLKDL